MTKRGMTLLELMVALVIASFLVALVLTVMVSFTQSYNTSEGTRTAQQEGRHSLEMLESTLRSAGFGIDPALAIDVNVYRCTPPGSPTATCTMADGTAVTARARAAASDELVFYSRDSAYFGADLATEPAGRAWSLASAPASTSLTLNARTGDRFFSGQILLVVARPDRKSVV